MAAYIIGMMKVKDAERYSQYRAGVLSALQKHGGRFLVRGGAVRSLEGAPADKRVVVVEFASMDALQRFWNSPEYEALKNIRQEASDADIWAIEGV